MIMHESIFLILCYAFLILFDNHNIVIKLIKNRAFHTPIVFRFKNSNIVVLLLNESTSNLNGGILKSPTNIKKLIFDEKRE
jgi:hypothetical protein